MHLIFDLYPADITHDCLM